MSMFGYLNIIFSIGKALESTNEVKWMPAFVLEKKKKKKQIYFDQLAPQLSFLEVFKTWPVFLAFFSKYLYHCLKPPKI